jgi:hypothetical protein
MAPPLLPLPLLLPLPPPLLLPLTPLDPPLPPLPLLCPPLLLPELDPAVPPELEPDPEPLLPPPPPPPSSPPASPNSGVPPDDPHPTNAANTKAAGRTHRRSNISNHVKSVVQSQVTDARLVCDTFMMHGNVQPDGG